MTTLRPTRSRSRWRGLPWWAVALAVAVVGVALVAAGLVVTHRSDGSSRTAAARPSCTPTTAVPAAPPTAVRLDVYNATQRAGLARTTASSLQRRGFEVQAVTNDPERATVTGAAVVRYPAGRLTEARWVAAQVPGSTLAEVAASRTGGEVDLVLGDADRSLASTAAARAAFVASAPEPAC